MFRRVLITAKTDSKDRRELERQIDLRAELERLLPERKYLVSENERLQGVIESLAQLLNKQSDTNRLLTQRLALLEPRDRDPARKIVEPSVRPDAHYACEDESDGGQTSVDEADQAFLNQRPQHRDD